VLLVYGDLAAGGMVVPEDAERLATTLRRVRIAHLPWSGHNLHRDQSATFLALLVPFLTDPEEAI
jgi:pimeloyl-ACP methyl ester carboxylesterase